jgi:hypothetical protein
MQTVTPAFETAVAAPYKEIAPSALVAWEKNENGLYDWFTIGQSIIGGPDMLKGASNNPVAFADRYQYDNETDAVQDYTIKRTMSNLPWGVIMGTANITLLNANNRFTPNYDPIIGSYIKPDRPLKLGVGINGEYVTLFTGYSELPQSSIGSRLTTITAWDAMKFLSNKKSSLPVFVDTPANEIIEELLIEQGFDSTQFSIEASLQGAIGYLMVRDKKVTDIFKAICEAEGALMFCDENGVIRFWNRLHFNSNNTSRWTFDYDNMTDVEWTDTPVVNDAIVVAKPLKRVAFNKIWESGQAYVVPPGGSVTVFADFRDDLGSYPAISVVTPVYITGASSSSYQANYNEDGSGIDAGGDVSLDSVYLFGESYRMTFSNSGTKNAYVTKIQLYGIPAKVQVVDSKEQLDQVSIDAYGVNPDNGGDIIEIKNDLVQDAGTANALAYIYVKLFSGPLTRIKANVFGVPHLQIGDFVTVEEETTGRTLSMVVVGNEIGLAQNGKLTQRLDLEQRSVYQYFTIGLSKIGGSDYLAP